MPGLGEEFRAAREAKNLTLSDVSEQLHIRSVYLQSIEDEDWPAIAAPVYVRGFIRTYARFLGLDPEGAVAEFNASIGESAARAAETEAPRRIERGRGPSPWLWIATAVAIVLVAFVGYRYWEYANGEPVAAPSAAPASAAASAADASSSAGPGAVASDAASASPEPAPTGTPAPKRTIVLLVTAPSWLSVSVDGEKRYEGLMTSGRRAFHGSNADVRAGNAAGVTPIVNGKRLAPMGGSGDVVEKTYRLVEAP